MDLPKGTTQAISYTLDPETYFGSSSSPGLAAGWPVRLAAWQQQVQWWLGAVGAGLRGLAEGFWLRWGAECTMLLLLTAALVGANAVSLLLLLLVVLGMVLAAGPASSNGSAAQALSGGVPVPSRQRSNSGSNTGATTDSARVGSDGLRHQWWWWHLVLSVLVVTLVSCAGQASCAGLIQHRTHVNHITKQCSPAAWHSWT